MTDSGQSCTTADSSSSRTGVSIRRFSAPGLDSLRPLLNPLADVDDPVGLLLDAGGLIRGATKKRSTPCRTGVAGGVSTMAGGPCA